MTFARIPEHGEDGYTKGFTWRGVHNWILAGQAGRRARGQGDCVVRAMFKALVTNITRPELVAERTALIHLVKYNLEYKFAGGQP